METATSDDPGVAWLLSSPNPSVRFLTLTDVLGMPPDAGEAAVAREAIRDSTWVQALLAGQRAEGGFGVPSYYGWYGGTHWRLASLAKLAVRPGDPRVELAVADEVASVLPFFRQHGNTIARIGGTTRIHTCALGYALAAFSALGFANEPFTHELAEEIIAAQWPDGGWNSDQRRNVRSSSFWETHQPLWGLWEYHKATGSRAALTAAERAGEFFLAHRMVPRQHPRASAFALRDGCVVTTDWSELHFPSYWYYDTLCGLDAIRPLGFLSDQRAGAALEELRRRRRPDGTFAHTGFRYWRMPDEPDIVTMRKTLGFTTEGIEVVDWGRDEPNEMITVIALRILAAAGNL